MLQTLDKKKDYRLGTMAPLPGVRAHFVPCPSPPPSSSLDFASLPRLALSLPLSLVFIIPSFSRLSHDGTRPADAPGTLTAFAHARHLAVLPSSKLTSPVPCSDPSPVQSLSLTSLPVEVIELVAKEGGLATRDLNALCLTSRLLWKVSSLVPAPSSTRPSLER